MRVRASATPAAPPASAAERSSRSECKVEGTLFDDCEILTEYVSTRARNESAAAFKRVWQNSAAVQLGWARANSGQQRRGASSSTSGEESNRPHTNEAVPSPASSFFPPSTTLHYTHHALPLRPRRPRWARRPPCARPQPRVGCSLLVRLGKGPSRTARRNVSCSKSGAIVRVLG